MRTVVVALLSFPVVLLAIWLGVSLLLSYSGGWHALAKQYPAAGPFEGEKSHMQNGWMGFWGYGWTLTAGATPESMHLSVMPLFRAGHPALDIPLSDVRVSSGGSLAGLVALIEFERAPGVKLRILPALARRLADQSRGRLVLPSELDDD